MRPLKLPERPRLAEYLLLCFAVLGVLANVTSYWNGELFWGGADPFANYHANPGIRSIETVAAVVGISLAVLIGVAAWRRRLEPPAAWPLVVLCLLGATLPYLELWWGSTFYYGEVRDKQGLPFGVSFGGPTGAAVFITYLLSRMGLPLGRGWSRRGLLFAFCIALMWLQVQALRPLEERWRLWQSSVPQQPNRRMELPMRGPTDSLREGSRAAHCSSCGGR
jgi:hypothetical protein